MGCEGRGRMELGGMGWDLIGFGSVGLGWEGRV